MDSYQSIMSSSTNTKPSSSTLERVEQGTGSIPFLVRVNPQHFLLISTNLHQRLTERRGLKLKKVSSQGSITSLSKNLSSGGLKPSSSEREASNLIDLWEIERMGTKKAGLHMKRQWYLIKNQNGSHSGFFSQSQAESQREDVIVDVARLLHETSSNNENNMQNITTAMNNNILHCKLSDQEKETVVFINAQGSEPLPSPLGSSHTKSGGLIPSYDDFGADSLYLDALLSNFQLVANRLMDQSQSQSHATLLHKHIDDLSQPNPSEKNTGINTAGSQSSTLRFTKDVYKAFERFMRQSGGSSSQQKRFTLEYLLNKRVRVIMTITRTFTTSGDDEDGSIVDATIAVLNEVKEEQQHIVVDTLVKPLLHSEGNLSSFCVLELSDGDNQSTNQPPRALAKIVHAMKHYLYYVNSLTFCPQSGIRSTLSKVLAVLVLHPPLSIEGLQVTTLQGFMTLLTWLARSRVTIEAVLEDFGELVFVIAASDIPSSWLNHGAVSTASSTSSSSAYSSISNLPVNQLIDVQSSGNSGVGKGNRNYKDKLKLFVYSAEQASSSVTTSDVMVATKKSTDSIVTNPSKMVKNKQTEQDLPYDTSATTLTIKIKDEPTGELKVVPPPPLPAPVVPLFVPRPPQKKLEGKISDVIVGDELPNRPQDEIILAPRVTSDFDVGASVKDKHSNKKKRDRSNSRSPERMVSTNKVSFSKSSHQEEAKNHLLDNPSVSGSDNLLHREKKSKTAVAKTEVPTEPSGVVAMEVEEDNNNGENDEEDENEQEEEEEKEEKETIEETDPFHHLDENPSKLSGNELEQEDEDRNDEYVSRDMDMINTQGYVADEERAQSYFTPIDSEFVEAVANMRHFIPEPRQRSSSSDTSMGEVEELLINEYNQILARQLNDMRFNCQMIDFGIASVLPALFEAHCSSAILSEALCKMVFLLARRDYSYEANLVVEQQKSSKAVPALSYYEMNQRFAFHRIQLIQGSEFKLLSWIMRVMVIHASHDNISSYTPCVLDAAIKTLLLFLNPNVAVPKTENIQFPKCLYLFTKSNEGLGGEGIVSLDSFLQVIHDSILYPFIQDYPINHLYDGTLESQQALELAQQQRVATVERTLTVIRWIFESKEFSMLSSPTKNTSSNTAGHSAMPISEPLFVLIKYVKVLIALIINRQARTDIYQLKVAYGNSTDTNRSTNSNPLPINRSGGNQGQEQIMSLSEKTLKFVLHSQTWLPRYFLNNSMEIIELVVPGYIQQPPSGSKRSPIVSSSHNYTRYLYNYDSTGSGNIRNDGGSTEIAWKVIINLHSICQRHQLLSQDDILKHLAPFHLHVVKKLLTEKSHPMLFAVETSESKDTGHEVHDGGSCDDKESENKQTTRQQRDAIIEMEYCCSQFINELLRMKKKEFVKHPLCLGVIQFVIGLLSNDPGSSTTSKDIRKLFFNDLMSYQSYIVWLKDIFTSINVTTPEVMFRKYDVGIVHDTVIDILFRLNETLKSLQQSFPLLSTEREQQLSHQQIAHLRKRQDEIISMLAEWWYRIPQLQQSSFEKFNRLITISVSESSTVTSSTMTLYDVLIELVSFTVSPRVDNNDESTIVALDRSKPLPKGISPESVYNALAAMINLCHDPSVKHHAFAFIERQLPMKLFSTLINYSFPLKSKVIDSVLILFLHLLSNDAMNEQEKALIKRQFFESPLHLHKWLITLFMRLYPSPNAFNSNSSNNNNNQSHKKMKATPAMLSNPQSIVNNTNTSSNSMSVSTSDIASTLLLTHEHMKPYTIMIELVFRVLNFFLEDDLRNQVVFQENQGLHRVVQAVRLLAYNSAPYNSKEKEKMKERFPDIAKSAKHFFGYTRNALREGINTLYYFVVHSSSSSSSSTRTKKKDTGSSSSGGGEQQHHNLATVLKRVRSELVQDFEVGNLLAYVIDQQRNDVLLIETTLRILISLATGSSENKSQLVLGKVFDRVIDVLDRYSAFTIANAPIPAEPEPSETVKPVSKSAAKKARIQEKQKQKFQSMDIETFIDLSILNDALICLEKLIDVSDVQNMVQDGRFHRLFLHIMNLDFYHIQQLQDKAEEGEDPQLPITTTTRYQCQPQHEMMFKTIVKNLLIFFKLQLPHQLTLVQLIQELTGFKYLFALSIRWKENSIQKEVIDWLENVMSYLFAAAASAASAGGRSGSGSESRFSMEDLQAFWYGQYPSDEHQITLSISGIGLIVELIRGCSLLNYRKKLLYRIKKWLEYDQTLANNKAFLSSQNVALVSLIESILSDNGSSVVEMEIKELATQINNLLS